VRIVGGDAAEAGVKVGDPVAMRVEAELPLGEERAFQDGVEPDRHRQPDGKLGRRAQRLVRREHLVGLPVVGPVRDRHAEDGRTQDPVAGLAADHQRDLVLALRDAAARRADQRLLEHADAADDGACAGRADGAGDHPARIAVAPTPVRDVDAPDLAEDVAAPASAPACRTASIIRSIGSAAARGSSWRWVASPMPTSTGVSGSMCGRSDIGSGLRSKANGRAGQGRVEGSQRASPGKTQSSAKSRIIRRLKGSAPSATSENLRSPMRWMTNRISP
jgi:hypothetical protein